MTDSYATLAQANAFHSARNNAEWTGTDASKTAALIRSTDYIDAFYSIEAEDDDPLLTKATILLAALALAGSLLTPVERGTKSEKVASGSTSVETVFDDAQSDPYPFITAILAPIAKPVAAAGSGLTIGTLFT